MLVQRALLLPLVSLALLLPCLPARAIDMTTYEAQRKIRPDMLRAHLVGLGDGLTWAAAAAAARGDKGFFCPPPWPLEAENYMALIDTEKALNPAVTPHTEVGYVLFEAMRRAYPC